MWSLFRKKAMLDEHIRKRIEAGIHEAESKTSGEIRVYMESHCPHPDALQRVKEIFTQLEMEKTTARNAVLIYVALTDRKFAIFGDTAIYEKAGGAQFWEKAAEKLTGHLKKNEIADGLYNCIHELGAALAEHFPYTPSTKKNELPDDIVFGK
jgi:uncharacterized membrane protein